MKSLPSMHETSRDTKELKHFKIRKIVTLLASLVMMGIISLNIALPQLADNVIISSTGNILTQQIVAKSGSPQDIQAAVNAIAAIGGGTVHVPEGEWEFNPPQQQWGCAVNVPGGVNIIGAGIGRTVLKQTITTPGLTTYFFCIDGSNGKDVRISGFTLKVTSLPASDPESAQTVGITIDNTKDFRIDNISFYNFTNMAIYVGYYSRGVIDHCIFDNPYKDMYNGMMWGYGVVVSGDYNSWDNDITKYLGKYETAPPYATVAYIEDCSFSRCRHMVASTQSAWYVIRYCIIDNNRPENYGSIDVHGASSSTTPGGRGLEAYNNVITGTSGYSVAQAFWIRGGSGVIFNNTLQNILYGVGLYRDSEISTYQVQRLYIWGNTMVGGTLINNYAGYTENSNYFLRAPSQQQDGFTYTPYPYPHPLTLG